VSVVRLAACQVSESNGRVRGLSVGAGHFQTAGSDISQIRSGRDLEASALQQTEGGMERGETTEPNGGVMIVAIVVCTLIAFATGVLVGYGAALVLR
jgi:hypothetical protein